MYTQTIRSANKNKEKNTKKIPALKQHEKTKRLNLNCLKKLLYNKNGGLIWMKPKIKTHQIIILMGFRVFKKLLCDRVRIITNALVCINFPLYNYISVN